jgi:CRP-like cAMP-binding protein
MARKEKLWYLSRMELFREMDREAMERLSRISVMTEMKKRSRVFQPGDPSDRIYLLKKGVVKICTLTEEGKDIALDFLHAGDVFGELAVVDPSPREQVAEVHEDALICILSRNDFLDLMRRYSELAFRVTKLLGFRLRRLSNRVEKLLFKSAHARLAQTLLDLSKEHGVPDARGVLMTLKLSQQELGSLIGLSRESVNLCLNDFKRQGLVESQGRMLRLLDVERLASVE